MQRESSNTRSSGEESEASMDVGSEKKYGTTGGAAACQKSRAAEVKNRRLALLQHSKDERNHPSPVKCRRRIGEDTKEARENAAYPKIQPLLESFCAFYLSFFLSVVGRAFRISSTARRFRALVPGGKRGIWMQKRSVLLGFWKAGPNHLRTLPY
jgi:hypothetical protein